MRLSHLLIVEWSIGCQIFCWIFCSLRFFNADRFQNTMVYKYFKLNYECTHTYTPAQTTRLRNSFLLEHSGQSPCPCIFLVSGQMKLECHLSGKNRFQKAFRAGVGVAAIHTAAWGYKVLFSLPSNWKMSQPTFCIISADAVCRFNWAL